MRRVEELIQLKPHEEIVTIVREYLITQAIPLTIGSLGYLVTLFVTYPLFGLGMIGRLVWGIGLVFTLGFVVRRLYLWYFEVFVITNQRCIDIQRTGIFARQVQEFPWGSVNDIVFSQHGIWATLLSYGTVTIVLANNRTVPLQHVYLPDRLRDILAAYVEKLH